MCGSQSGLWNTKGAGVGGGGGGERTSVGLLFVDQVLFLFFCKVGCL